MPQPTDEKLTDEPEVWRTFLRDDPDTITRLLLSMHRIAVVGIKPESAGGPAYTVPARLQALGHRIIPVPVYFPDVTTILGAEVHRGLASVPPPIDAVLLFRRSGDIPQHLPELLAAAPRVVWMQQGIRHDAVAEVLARAGIHVVMDRCLQVEREGREAPPR